METQVQVDTQIRVVKRDTIPPIHSVEQDGQVHQLGELRDFRWSEELRAFMPEELFSASWVVLNHGEVLQVHTHPTQSMMVVYEGSGELMGDLSRSIQEGDVVVVPPGQRHGFVGGERGLFALSIQFGEGLYTKPHEPRVIFADAKDSLTALFALHDERASRLGMHPAFHVPGGLLQAASQREALPAAWYTFMERSGKSLSASHATCSNPEYNAAFKKLLEHHAVRLRAMRVANPRSRADGQVHDAILIAIGEWFAHQGFTLDDAEKVVLTHLVLDRTYELCEQCALAVRGEPIAGQKAGTGSLEVAYELLRNHTSLTYERLTTVVGEGWDMIESVADRVTEMVRLR